MRKEKKTYSYEWYGPCGYEENEAHNQSVMENPSEPVSPPLQQLCKVENWAFKGSITASP